MIPGLKDVFPLFGLQDHRVHVEFKLDLEKTVPLSSHGAEAFAMNKKVLALWTVGQNSNQIARRNLQLSIGLSFQWKRP